MIGIEVSYKGKSVNIQGGATFSNLYAEDVREILVNQLISVSLQVLDQTQKQDKFPKENFITLVDNKLSNRLDNVKPFGNVVFKTKLESLRPVLLFAIQSIVERSPERTGAYLANHVLFKNNTFVAKGFSNIISFIQKDNATDKDIYRFVNMSPYARKLERYRITKQTRGKYKGQNITKGKRKGKVRGKEVTIPSGAYVLANRSIRRKFKELKNNIRFSFLPIEPSVAMQLDSSGKDTTGYVFKGTKKNPGNGRPYLYPSITITGIPQAVSFNRGFTERF